MLAVAKISRASLRPVTFDVGRGECLAVRGPSGAGKSLLLRAIADLDPAEGDAWIDGAARDSMSGPQWRRLVGYLPAEPGWWADTVGAHFSDWRRAVPLVERLGLPEEAGSWPMTRPSTGERLRLALVRALLVEPRVLLLDEPTAALDGQAVAKVEALIAERLEQGLTVVWVTHDDAQVRRVARRALSIDNGICREDRL